jgi:transposase
MRPKDYEEKRRKRQKGSGKRKKSRKRLKGSRERFRPK